MSYQAITNIIVNPSQLQDLQLSNTVKDSPKQPSVSFADILASYNTEKTEKPASEPEKVKEPEKAEKNENSSEKNQVKDEKEPEKTSEKAVDKTDSEEKTEKADSKEVSDKQNKTKNAADETELEVKDAGTKTEKVDAADEKASKNKKLSDKDFSRLDEITKASEAIEDASKLAAVQNSVKSDKLEIKADKAEGEAEDAALSALTENAAAATDSLAKTDAETANSGFEFSGNTNQETKKFALDKDGKITVEDQRTKVAEENDNSKKSIVKTSDIKLTNENTAVMSVELNPNAEADVLSLNTQTAASSGSNFQAMLSNQLHNVAPEFVKAGSLILKDNNQGTINLVLHPDDLGNVKIHLSLDGKTLSGHITVATKEALQVFKDNAETLREAFIKNGFDAASFDVAMNNGGSFNQGTGFEGQDDGRNMIAKRLYGGSGDSLSAELDDIFENAEDISNYSVNIVA